MISTLPLPLSRLIREAENSFSSILANIPGKYQDELAARMRLPAQAGVGAVREPPLRDSRLTPFFNLLDQIIEEQPVQWQEGIPIYLSRKTMRIIVDDDGQPSSAALVLDIEFQPGFSRQFHLRPQKEALVRLKILRPPKIDHIVDFQCRLAPSAAGGPDAE